MKTLKQQQEELEKKLEEINNKRIEDSKKGMISFLKIETLDIIKANLFQLKRECKIIDWDSLVGDDIDDYWIRVKDVKEFIRRLKEFIEVRRIELSEFDGLAEIMLQKAEIENIKRELDKLAGDKLI